jgi:hypothetical protein
MVFSIESGRWTLDVGDMERACLHRTVRHELYARMDRTQEHNNGINPLAWLQCGRRGGRPSRALIDLTEQL